MVTDNAMCNMRLDEAPSKCRQGFPSNILRVWKGIQTNQVNHFWNPQTNKHRWGGTLVCVSTYTPDRTFRKCTVIKYWTVPKKGHPRQFSKPPTSFSLVRNIKDNFLQSDIGPGTFPWFGCTQFNNIQKGPTFTHPRTANNLDRRILYPQRKFYNFS